MIVDLNADPGAGPAQHDAQPEPRRRGETLVLIDRRCRETDYM